MKIFQVHLKVWSSFDFKKWLLICSYNPRRNSIKENMRVHSCCLDQDIQKSENIILMGDYNAKVTEACMQEFCESYNFRKHGEKTNMLQ